MALRVMMTRTHLALLPQTIFFLHVCVQIQVYKHSDCVAVRTHCSDLVVSSDLRLPCRPAGLSLKVAISQYTNTYIYKMPYRIFSSAAHLVAQKIQLLDNTRFMSSMSDYM